MNFSVDKILKLWENSLAGKLLRWKILKIEMTWLSKVKKKNTNRCRPKKRFFYCYLYFCTNVHLSLSIISLSRSSYCTLIDFREPITLNILHFSHRWIAWKQDSSDLFEVNQTLKASITIRFCCLFTLFNLEFSFCFFLYVERRKTTTYTACCKIFD